MDESHLVNTFNGTREFSNVKSSKILFKYPLFDE